MTHLVNPRILELRNLVVAKSTFLLQARKYGKAFAHQSLMTREKSHYSYEEAGQLLDMPQLVNQRGTSYDECE